MDPNVNSTTPQQPDYGKIVSSSSQEEKSPFFNKLTKIFQTRKILLGVFIFSVLIIAVLYAFLRDNKSSTYADAELLIEQAQNAYTAGDLEVVKSKLKEVLNDYPNDPGLEAALIKTIANQGNLTGTEVEKYSELEPYLKNALDKNPNNLDVLLAAGYAEETAGNYTKALDYYQKALQANQSSALAWFHSAHVYEFLGRASEANMAYERAYELDRNNPSIVSGMARVSISKGNIPEAIQHYKDASGIPNIPNDLKADALVNASILTRNQILYMQEAIELSKQALQIAPNYAPALATHGYNLGINGKYDEGVSLLKKSIEANPRISQNYWQLAQLLRSANNNDEAIMYFNQSLDIIDQDNTILGDEAINVARARISYDLAKTYSLIGDSSRVVELLSDALRLDPTIKPFLVDDYGKYGQFANMRNNQSFLSLLN